jgi:SAM-dependent methyltransferase
MSATPESDRRFTGSVAALYESLLVPMIFAPYALDLAARAAARRPLRVLELAAGTGVATRALDAALPPRASIVATDLNQAMLDQAVAVGGLRREVEWRQADAIALPFEDASFDLVACQFGVMFFPDKGRAFAEARRVLAPGGTFLFNAWDAIEANEFAEVVTTALAGWWPADPPSFLARTPHGYNLRSTIEADLARGGFGQPAIFDTVAARSPAPSARAAAVAYCQGTPLRGEIEARDPDGLEEATQAAERALVQRYGAGAIEGDIRALVIEARK